MGKMKLNESESHVSRDSMQSYIVTYYKRQKKDPLIALESLVFAPAVLLLGRRGGGLGGGQNIFWPPLKF